MFEKKSYPKSSPSLPKSTMSASGRATLGLTGFSWRQTPIVGTGTHRVHSTHAAPTGCTNTTYASTLRTTLQRCREQFRYRRSNAFPLSPLQPSPPPTSVKSDAPRGEVTCVWRSSRVSTIQGSFPESSRVSTIQGSFRAFQVSQFK